MNNKENKKFALIVAGGSGTRMKSVIPKQFLEIDGKPILMHTIEVFKAFDPEIEIILVLPEIHIRLWEQLCEKYHFSNQCQIAFGGETRFQSVSNGLQLIHEPGIVFIHDSVRPLVSKVTLENCLKTAATKGNALPVIPVNETVRMVEGEKNYIVARSKVFLVQTPQTFQIELIKKAYLEAKSDNFTDDASVLEESGLKINLVDGNPENIKITTPFDMVLAETIIKSQQNSRS